MIPGYLLTILSSGRREYLDRTLASFAEMVTPAPSAVYVYDDGGTLPIDAFWPVAPGVSGVYDGGRTRLGMCAAHANCWNAAARSELPFVFHIEDDMVFLRPTNLVLIESLLRAQPHLAQVTLLRCPWGAEVPHGGYIPQTPGWYERKTYGIRNWRVEDVPVEVIETTRNWANAPTLFRTELARQVEWPAEPGCETTIGPRILALNPDARFGIWGAGEPWVAHVGIDRAAGSHGY